MVKPVEKDDGCGFGDRILCCPICGKPITVPLFTRLKGYIICSCGTTIVLEEKI